MLLSRVLKYLALYLLCFTGICIILTGCYEQIDIELSLSTEASTQSTSSMLIPLSNQLITICGSDQNTMLQYIAESEAPCKAVTRGAEGRVVVSVTEEQRQEWIDVQLSHLYALQQEFYELNSYYAVELRHDFRLIEVYCDEALSPETLSFYVSRLQEHCLLYQAFHNISDTCYMKINIYNTNTGMLVASGGNSSKISFDSLNWRVDNE